MTTKTISLEEFQLLQNENQPLNLIDVRTPAEFERLHARGARSIPLDQLDPAAIASLRIDPSQPIYVICQAGTRAAKACEQFAQAGIMEVYSVEGGTAAWVRAGLPVIEGQSRVISLERQVRIGAGSLVLLGLTLGWFIHPIFLLVSAFVGGGLVFAGVTDWCGMALLLAKMPWNRKRSNTPPATTCSA